MLREIISRCKTIKYCADNFTQDFGLDLMFVLININLKLFIKKDANELLASLKL